VRTGQREREGGEAGHAVPERMRWKRLNSYDEEPEGKEMEGGANAFHRNSSVRLVLVRCKPLGPLHLTHSPLWAFQTSIPAKLILISSIVQ
jgi:hypothetical protein